MFKKWADFVTRFRIPIIIFWVALVLVSVLFAPKLSESESAGQNETIFLPSDSQSVIADDLIAKYFPQEDTDSGEAMVLLFFNEKGLSDDDKNVAQAFEKWLLTSGPSVITDVQSIFSSPGLADRLISPDGTTMIMNVTMQSPHRDELNQALLDIRDYRDSLSYGSMDILATGSIAIAYDTTETLVKSIDTTTIVTIVLVVVLLLIIYRSPVAIFVPLLTIGAAYLVSRGALGVIGEFVSVMSQLDVIIIVLVFGVGTDYCLFMISRFREELSRNSDAITALKKTISRIGIVITASGFAVFVGLFALIVARFNMIQTAGPALSVSIIVTLLAAISLTPAVLSFTKRATFWPMKVHPKEGEVIIDPEHRKNFWGRVGTLATKYNVAVVIIIIALMAIPIAALYPNMKTSYNTLEQLGTESESGQSMAILQDHFNIAEIMPSYAVIVNENGITSPEALAEIKTLLDKISQVSGIGSVQSVITPAGDGEVNTIMYASTQLMFYAQMIGEAAQSGASTSTIGILQFTYQYLSELKNTFPEIDTESLQTEVAQAIALLLAGNPEGWQATAQVANNIGALGMVFAAGDNPMMISTEMAKINQSYATLLYSFVSQDGKAMQIYVLPAGNPYSNEAMAAMQEARTVLADFTASSSIIAKSAIGGATASMVDVQEAMEADMLFIQIVVICAIFIILAVLLRSLVAPIFLLATVLLSYFTTMGLCSWIFVDILGHSGVSFFVPLIVFVLLVALGSDYNIFLMSRVREEAEKKPMKPAVRGAVAVSGGIISACGLILGGTFLALALSPIQMLVQMGIAVALGVFMDAFIVRPLLVPAITSLIGRFVWWPFGHQKQKELEKIEKHKQIGE